MALTKATANHHDVPNLNGVPWPDAPSSWYHACSYSELGCRPRRLDLIGTPLVVFKTNSGQVSALDAQCVHLGADLSRGSVQGKYLRCSFHEWCFDRDGRCVHIPASPIIPAFARQGTYPTAIVGPHVFVFNTRTAPYEMPFFEGMAPDRLHPAKPFVLQAKMDWWMVAANGFDLQHFRAAHDRTLVGEPITEDVSPFARRITATFDVTGSGWRDRSTRAFSGPRVTMSVTSYGGTIVLVTASFRRTTSYGMVCIRPTAPGRSELRVIAWVPRSRTSIGRALVDPVDAAVRRSFIRAFVRSDQERSVGIRYSPASLIDADRVLADYFMWLGGQQRPECRFE